MTIDTQTAVALGLPIIGGLVWLIRLEGKVQLNQRLTEDLIDDVKYIRSRIDAAINGHHD